ncbi:unnamed protein product [Sphagnum jensenii]|uniref:Cytochrome c domain-containing protein n=1 Tax=Sphagnum jensenii TaxID=128206 RepID=A0ABP0V7U1_9BRYO
MKLSTQMNFNFIGAIVGLISLSSCLTLQQDVDKLRNAISPGSAPTGASNNNPNNNGGGGTPTSSPTPSVIPGVPNAAFQSCFTSNPTTDGGVQLASCLNASAVGGAVFTSTQIATCVAAGNASSSLLPICLSKNGQVVLQNHSALQFEIDACNSAVGESGIAGCLAKHGADLGITQPEIDQCNTAAGESGIEKCLHKNAFIATQAIVMQNSANLCNLVEGGTTTMALCLQNSLQLPATVTQADIDTCVTAVTEADVIRCLRVKYFIPNTLMQYHINYCSTAVGPTAIANCLNTNGVLPINPLPSPTPAGVAVETAAQIVADLQLDINSCITAVGEADVAQCLRKRGIISNQVMQSHIDSCFAVAGVNAYNCLAANFAVLPTTLTTDVLQACFTKNGGTSAGAASCLAAQGILPTAAQQTHINECARSAGIDADATATLPGQIGIAACLQNSGLLPTGVTQAEIDTCIGAVGLQNASACLANKAYIPSYAQMISTTGVFGTYCVSCHNANEMNGNMNISSHASILGKVNPGNAAGSTLYKEISSGAMPKNGPNLVNTEPALVSLIEAWINQGANDDVDVPATASAPITTGTTIGNLTGGGGLAAAFNGTTSQTAAKSAEATAVGGFIGKEFTAPETITKYVLYGSSDLCYNNPATNGATTLLLQYSDDGVTYTIADTVTTTATCTGPEMISRNVPGSNLAHMYWRISQAAGSKGDLIVGQLQFYGY